ncbi:MAG: hypothetical protein N3G20_09590 [Verrucomicrobiae bacterium]|nr:hypothetical protein [Verrucomicrobiae bacterium]
MNKRAICSSGIRQRFRDVHHRLPTINLTPLFLSNADVLCAQPKAAGRGWSGPSRWTEVCTDENQGNRAPGSLLTVPPGLPQTLERVAIKTEHGKLATQNRGLWEDPGTYRVQKPGFCRTSITWKITSFGTTILRELCFWGVIQSGKPRFYVV